MKLHTQDKSLIEWDHYNFNQHQRQSSWTSRLLPRTPLGLSSQELPSRAVSFITLKPYEEKPHWSTSHLPKQRRHSTTCKKSSCSTTSTDGFNRRRLVQCTKWHRRYWHSSKHNYIHGLCYNPMDRRWPTSMEPLQHRWTPYHKSHRGLAQQTEESLPCAPKHLHIDQHIQRHPCSK